MIKRVVLCRRVERQLENLPKFIGDKFFGWVCEVERVGLQQVRKVPGYHDEPLKGVLNGLRSIRLSRSYRAYYRIMNDHAKFVKVERIDKHEY